MLSSVTWLHGLSRPHVIKSQLQTFFEVLEKDCTGIFGSVRDLMDLPPVCNCKLSFVSVILKNSIFFLNCNIREQISQKVTLTMSQLRCLRD
jgi:hypothetical protein